MNLLAVSSKRVQRSEENKLGRRKHLQALRHWYGNNRIAQPYYLTIRPVARKGYGSIAHEAKPNGLLTRGP